MGPRPPSRVSSRGAQPIYRDAALKDDVAEDADGGSAELALPGLRVQFVVQQCLEHHMHVHQMLLASLGEDEDVVSQIVSLKLVYLLSDKYMPRSF